MKQLMVNFLYSVSSLNCWIGELVQEKDFQKTVLPSRLASMALQSSMSSTEMDSQLAKLELADGSNVVAKLVVRLMKCI